MKWMWLACCVPMVASAAPTTLTAQGRVLDVGGTPLSVTTRVDFALYGQQTGGTALWSESHPNVVLTDGYYSVVLGDSVAIGGTVVARPELWLGVSVDSADEMSRSPVTAVLAARSADHIPVVSSTGAVSCTDTGAIAWDTSSASLRVCDGARWFSLQSSQTVISNGVGRQWSDGTFAASCADYLTPSIGYEYRGLTGDGVYTIDPDGSGTAYDSVNVMCDMSNGGWTRVSTGGGYGARDSQWLVFDGLGIPFTNLRLEHVGGATRCNTSQSITNAWSACNGLTSGICGFVISNGPSSVVYNSGSYSACDANGGFTVTGTAAFGDRFLERTSATTLGPNSRLAYYEDWFNASESNNGGTHSVDIWLR